MMTPEEKAKMQDEKTIAKLKEKKFKCYEFALGDKKISDKGDLKPYKCKNLTGVMRNDDNFTDLYFAQTNKGAEMGKKLILRQMRQDRKQTLAKAKAMRNDINMLKGTTKQSKDMKKVMAFAKKNLKGKV